MDWGIFQSVEAIILLNSSCTAIHDNFCVTKTTLQMYLDAIFLQLKSSSLKHLSYLMSSCEINNKSVRKIISENNIKKLGQKLTFSSKKKHIL